MSDKANPFAEFAERSLFLVCAPPSLGPRSRVFAKELGIQELHYVYSTQRRGLLAAPYKYSYQAVQTLRLLFRKRPQIVFVQSPPSLAVLFVYIYCALTGSRYIVDVHSDALINPFWTTPRWLHGFLARRAVAMIVTSEHYQKQIQSQGATAFVLRDIPTTFPEAGSYPLSDQFNVVVVNTFFVDEPLEAVLEAAAELEPIQFYVTGKKSRGDERLLSRAPANVHFTDFLPDEQYYSLLKSSSTVMCLTTRDNTMQRGACEALSLGKTIITSDWTLLREYFHQGTVHVQNTCEGIQQGVREMLKNYDKYQAGILALQQTQHQEWEKKVSELTGLIRQSMV
jgi:glycosyltransferase involved in cell wall biosynthesis